MKQYEAKSLEDACDRASIELGCLVEDLVYKVIEHPKAGVMGMFSRNAIIEVDTDILIDARYQTSGSFLNDAPISTEESMTLELDRDEVIDSFYDSDTFKQFTHTIKTNDVQADIEIGLKKLFDSSCFDIDTMEVDVKNETAYIFLDGEDAALLIGKVGYRYNALYYMISNWLQAKYRLHTKLEIAKFVTEQKEMISSMMKPVIEHVLEKGWAKTRTLDGVLVELALEELRARFPDKYVAIKKYDDDQRYILINRFN